MKNLRVAVMFLAIASVCSVASAGVFSEDFESYAAGSSLHGQGGWKGWDNTASAGAPTSNSYAVSGSNSVEIVPAADLVHEFDITGGKWEFSVMQYIPSGATGTSFFILLNTYNDGGSKDWSVQTQFHLDTAAITTQYDGSATATIVYDQWVEFKCVIDLDNNTVDEYYNGVFFSTHQWDGDLHDTLQAIDLYGNNASSIYYDDITITAPPGAYNPEPADGSIHVATWVSLKWRPGDQAVSHDVYFSDSFADVNNRTAEAFRGNQAIASLVAGFPGFAFPDGLVPGTTYYWLIDEVGADGAVTHGGDVWSFMIPPRTAYLPDPIDGANYVLTDAQLNWTEGFNAKLHTVFFGETFDDVNNAVAGPPQPATSYDPGPLVKDKTYYWRIDEFDGAQIIRGNVWSFTTISDIAVSDPNLLGWWKLDEGPGNTAVDSSGYDNHGTITGGSQWVDGVDGGALDFAGSGKLVEAMSFKGVTGMQSRTVSAWIKTRALGEIASWGANSAGQKWIFRVQNSDGNAGAIRVEVNGGYQVGSIDLRNDQWHHVAAVLADDGTPDVTEITLYVDGVPEAISAQLDEQIDTAASSNVRIGQAPWGTRPFSGLIDDVRVYDKALTADEIKLVMRVDPLLAWNASPVNGSTPDVGRAATLAWSAGDAASSHDVYLGADADAVDSADSSDTTGVYRGQQNATSYTAPEGVQWGAGPFFWRIDENNADGTVTKGRVWSFAVADFLLVDDFESYNNVELGSPESNRLFDSWLDGFGSSTNGGLAGNDLPPYAEMSVVHGGYQSMPLSYDNNLKYSEATLTLTYPRDWTAEGVTELSLWFKGELANAAEPMYVTLNGTAVKYHDDPAAAQTIAWTQWIIPLQAFADQGVDLANVSTITIGLGNKANVTAGGTGKVYIDDIQLNRPEQ